MIFEHFCLILAITLATANFKSENYNIFENSTFFSVGRIIFKTQIPNTIEPTECLFQCNKIRNCLNVLFQKKQGLSLCELGFIPHNFTGVIQSLSDSTLYQKISRNKKIKLN